MELIQKLHKARQKQLDEEILDLETALSISLQKSGSVFSDPSSSIASGRKQLEYVKSLRPINHCKIAIVASTLGNTLINTFNCSKENSMTIGGSFYLYFLLLLLFSCMVLTLPLRAARQFCCTRELVGTWIDCVLTFTFN